MARLLKKVFLLLFVFVVIVLIFAVLKKEKRGEKKEKIVVVSPPETVFVSKDNVVYKTQKIFVPKVDTVVKYDTVYAFGEGIVWKARIERELLDYFVLIDTLRFSHLDEKVGLFGVNGLLYQKEQIPIFLELKLKDSGIYYIYSTPKSWYGRFNITARYYDERNPFKIYAGAGLILGNAMSLNLGVLYREKYFVSGFITSNGQLGLSLQIKLNDFIWKK